MNFSAKLQEEGPPERCLAVYKGEELVIVLRRKGGYIFGPFLDAHPPLLSHPNLSGKIMAAEYLNVLTMLEEETDPANVAKSLEGLGLIIRETPISALSWCID